MTIIESDIRKLSLEELHQRFNPNWTEHYGWRIPSEFAGVPEEYRALNNGCGLMEKSYYGRISVRGETAQDFLHRMTSAPVNDLRLGQGMETVVTTAEGRFVDWVIVFRSEEDEMFLITAPNSQDKIIEHLKEYIFFKDDVRFEKTGHRWAMLQMSGPQSIPVAEEIFGIDLKSANPYRLISNQTGEITITGNVVNDITDSDILLFFPNDGIEVVQEMLETSDDLWVPVGFTAAEIARIEAGVPRYPGEINEEHIPPEAHIEKSVDLDSCFAGQEVIARTINYEKTKQHLCHVEIDSGTDKPLEPPILMLADEQKVGEITSLIWSPVHEKYLGLGYVLTRYLPNQFPLKFSTEPRYFEGNITGKTTSR